MIRIGELASRAGVSTRALRYYEEQGLLHPVRTLTGQRMYDASAVDRVRLIQQLFSAGLGSELLVTLLPAIDDGRLTDGLSDRLVLERARLGAKIVDLQAAYGRLSALIAIAAHPDDASCPATLDDAVALAASAAR